MTYSWCLRVVTVLCIVGLMAVSCNANVFIETAGENQTMSPVLSLEDTNNTNSIGSVSPLDTQQSLTEMPSSLSPKEIAATEAQTRDRINGFSGTSDDDLMSQGLGIITSDPNPVSPSDVRSREEIVASESHVRAIMSEATIQRPKVDDFSVITNSPTYHVVSTPSPEEIASMEAQVKELLVDSYFQGAAPEGFSIATSVPLSGEGLNLTPDEIGASESYIKEQLEGSTLQSPIPEGFSIATSTPHLVKERVLLLKRLRSWKPVLRNNWRVQLCKVLFPRVSQSLPVPPHLVKERVLLLKRLRLWNPV